MKHLLLISILSVGLAAFANKPTVIAYLPAPGQFVNTMPKADAGADSLSMAAAANTALERGSMVNLGGFGGYITMRFAAPITNAAADDYDFTVRGNAYEGNSEPGVVWVSADANANGLPDDPWYELYGSEASRSTRPYSITYYRPSAADDAASGAVEQYIRWTDSEGATGYIPKNTFHKQSYYPVWVDADKITYTGTLLPDNAVFENNKWVLNAFDWGYADNQPNADTDGCSFKMEWARNADGTNANLTSIDFVKIHTGINKVNGNIGESSTEISGIEAIRQAELPTGTDLAKAPGYIVDRTGHTIIFDTPVEHAAIVDLGGRVVASYQTTDRIDYSTLPRGIYICITPTETIKLIK